MRQQVLLFGLVTAVIGLFARASSPPAQPPSSTEIWALDGGDAHNTNTGNAGIGTSAPVTRLGVDGAISVDGQEVIDASGNLVGGLPGFRRFNPRRVALERWYAVNGAGTEYTVGGTRTVSRSTVRTCGSPTDSTTRSRRSV